MLKEQGMMPEAELLNMCDGLMVGNNHCDEGEER